MEEILPKERPGSCRACGSSPTSHTATLLSSTVDAWINDRLQSLPAITFVLAWAYRIANRLEPTVLRLVYYVTGRQTLTDRSKALTNRAQVLWEEADRRGIEMEQIAVFGRPSEYYRAKREGEWRYFESLVIPAQKKVRPYTWLDDKFIFKCFLRDAGIPAANAFVTTSLSEARERFKDFGAPVVVKPRVGSRARHTMTNVRTIEVFEEAFRSAQELCRYVLFEEHLAGKLCRATLVDGKVVGFLRKSYPEVIGDGQHTIAELVRIKNSAKPDRVWDITLDVENVEYLQRQGYAPDDILPLGSVIEVSASSGRMAGGDTCEMPAEIHPKLRTQLENISRILDVPLVGFDLIIPDPEADPDEQKWGILEANTLPFIDLHYNPLYGKTSNVAGALWDLWLEKNPA